VINDPTFCISQDIRKEDRLWNKLDNVLSGMLNLEQLSTITVLSRVALSLYWFSVCMSYQPVVGEMFYVDYSVWSACGVRTPEKKLEPRVDWVTCSSAYKKEEIDQPGAPQSKKITKVNQIHSQLCKDAHWHILTLTFWTKFRRFWSTVEEYYTIMHSFNLFWFQTLFSLCSHWDSGT